MAGEDERLRAERAARARERAERRRERASEGGGDSDSGRRDTPVEPQAPRPAEPEASRPVEPEASRSAEPLTSRAAERPAGPRPAAPGGRLSDAWARRIAAGLLAVAAIVAALAIFDLGPFADPPTDEELATGAVERFYSAASAGDWETFCGGLTPFARGSVETNVARLTGNESDGCVAALSSGGNSFEGLEIKIRDVNVVGNEARVETAVKLPGEPPELRSVLLIEEGGDWLVNDPG